MSKHNTDQTKTLLQKVINSVPADFALREVRFHLQQAAKKLEQVAKKRNSAEPKKLTQYQQWQERINAGLNNPYTGQHTIDIIDNMLGEEQAKLESILEKKKKSNTATDESEDTLLG